MPLENGVYTPNADKKVTVWPPADKDGDGDEVWEDVKDNDGNVIDRRRARDGDGNEVSEYAAPAGFQNRPSFDHTDNYVRVDNRGRVLRDINGHAVGIRPGHVLIEHGDGRSELHHVDSQAVNRFVKSHVMASGPKTEA